MTLKENVLRQEGPGEGLTYLLVQGLDVPKLVKNLFWYIWIVEDFIGTTKSEGWVGYRLIHLFDKNTSGEFSLSGEYNF